MHEGVVGVMWLARGLLGEALLQRARDDASDVLNILGVGAAVAEDDTGWLPGNCQR